MSLLLCSSSSSFIKSKLIQFPLFSFKYFLGDLVGVLVGEYGLTDSLIFFVTLPGLGLAATIGLFFPIKLIS